MEKAKQKLMILSIQKRLWERCCESIHGSSDWGHAGASSSLVKCLRKEFVCLQILSIRERSNKLCTSSMWCTRNEYVKPDL